MLAVFMTRQMPLHVIARPVLTSSHDLMSSLTTSLIHLSWMLPCQVQQSNRPMMQPPELLTFPTYGFILIYGYSATCLESLNKLCFTVVQKLNLLFLPEGVTQRFTIVTTNFLFQWMCQSPSRTEQSKHSASFIIVHLILRFIGL